MRPLFLSLVVAAAIALSACGPASLESRAQSGDAEAAEQLAGFYYFGGMGIAKDPEKAVKWMKVAADAGRPSAQYNMGAMYANGDGVAVDRVEALRWFRLAEAHGNAKAAFAIGVAYARGEGVPQDRSEGFRLLHKAASAGHVEAQRIVGEMLWYGDGVTANYTESLVWLRKAAEAGNDEAQVLLGNAYRSGTGVERDYAAAYQWLLKAAAQNNPSAELLIGQMTENGNGVELSTSEAIKWYRKAAAQGNEEAVGNLERFHAPVLLLQASRLAADYHANELRADGLYKGKLVSVTGTVLKIAKDAMGAPYVLLSGESEGVGNVACVLRESCVQQASALNAGQSVTLTGEIDGEGVGGAVLVKDSYF